MPGVIPEHVVRSKYSATLDTAQKVKHYFSYTRYNALRCGGRKVNGQGEFETLMKRNEHSVRMYGA